MCSQRVLLNQNFGWIFYTNSIRIILIEQYYILEYILKFNISKLYSSDFNKLKVSISIFKDFFSMYNFDSRTIKVYL